MRSRAEPDPALASGPGWRPDRRQLGQAALALAGAHVLAPAQAAKPPVRGIGVNCFDLFYGRLFAPGVKAPAVRLKPLADLGIPFVRFAASPFWPVEWQRHYLDQRSRYFDLLDEVVRAAEDAHLQLVPSLFWYAPAVSDLMGEPASAWARPESKTQAFMRRYVADVVGRYASSPAVLAWEFGNELNSYANLPNATKWWPRVSVEMGTPAARTSADLISTLDCSSTFRQFARAVRTLMPSASVSAGSDMPLFNSTSLLKNRWEADSPQQAAEALILNAPEGVDLLSVHLYADKLKKLSGDRPTDLLNVTALIQKTAKQAGKQVFVGEFGVPDLGDDQRQARIEFADWLHAIQTAEINLAAVWVYDFAAQALNWSFSARGERAWILDEISKANRK